MEPKSKFWMVAVFFAVGIFFSASSEAQLNRKGPKRVKKTDLSEKAEKAERSEHSIFRKSKEQPKEEDKPQAEDETSEPRGLAGLFKRKPKPVEKDEESDEAEDEKSETKEEEEPVIPVVVKNEDEAIEEEISDEPKERRGLAALFKKKPKTDKKDEESDGAEDEKSETKEDEPIVPIVVKKEDEPKEEAEEKPKARGGLASIFKRNPNTDNADEKKTDLPKPVVIKPSESIAALPAPKFDKVAAKTGDDTVRYESWDDLPFKQRSTVDKMMGKLKFRETPKPVRRMMPLPLPLPAPRSALPSKPLISTETPTVPTEKKSSSTTEAAESKPASTISNTLEDQKKGELPPVIISD